jgi:hypothetical protein
MHVRRRSDGRIEWSATAALSRPCPVAGDGRLAWIDAGEAGRPERSTAVIADAADGGRRCEIALEGPRTAGLSLAGEVLVVTSFTGDDATDGTTRHAVYSASNCAPRWTRETAGWGGVALATDGGVLLHADRPSPTLSLHAAATGEALWSVPTGDRGGLLRAVRTGEQWLVLLGFNISTTLLDLDVGTGAARTPERAFEGGLGSELVEQTGVSRVLSMRRGLETRLLDLPSGRDVPVSFTDPLFSVTARSPLLAFFASERGSVDATAAMSMTLARAPSVADEDGIYTPRGRFVATRAVTVEAEVRADRLRVVLRGPSGPLAWHGAFVAVWITPEGEVACESGGPPDPSGAWSLPTTQAGPGAFVNAEQTIVCNRPWTEVHTLRALVTTPPFPGDPRDLPAPPWVGVAVSAPFAVR